MTDKTKRGLWACKICGTNGTGGVAVRINGAAVGTFRPTGRVAIYGYAGNDTLSALGLSRRADLFGGDGSDVLIGGSGAGTGRHRKVSANNRVIVASLPLEVLTRNYTRSKIAAIPCPPPMHIVTRA